MSNNETAWKITGTASVMGAIDRFTAQFFDTSYLAEILGTGDALTVAVAVIGFSALIYTAITLGLVDFDDL